jgi:hypothetical protein
MHISTLAMKPTKQMMETLVGKDDFTKKENGEVIEENQQNQE